MKTFLTMVGMLVAIAAPKAVQADTETRQNYGACLSLRPLCQVGTEPLCVCDYYGTNCNWICVGKR